MLVFTLLAVSHVGTLPQWLTVFTLLAVGLPLLRGARGTAISNLQRERDEYEREVKRLADDVVRLRATRDLGPVMEHIVAEIKRHEDASAKRDAGVLKVLDLIAARLGPNDE